LAEWISRTDVSHCKGSFVFAAVASLASATGFYGLSFPIYHALGAGPLDDTAEEIARSLSFWTITLFAWTMMVIALMRSSLADGDGNRERPHTVSAGRARTGPEPEQTVFWIRQGRKITPVAAEEVSFVTAERDYVRLHTDRASHLLRSSISATCDTLADDFVRIHRGTIIRRSLINELHRSPTSGWDVALSSGRRFRVGRRFLVDVRAALPARRG